MTRRPRLLLSTPPRASLETIAAALPAALATGCVASLRIDMPGAAEDEIRRAADRLREICHAADTAVLIREHYRLARPLGLDGAQVDVRAAPLRKVREEIGRDAILGVACGASRHDGITAAEAGADYVLFAPVHGAPGLGAGEEAPPELFEWWAEMIETPVVAEGGLTEIDAGAFGEWVDFAAPDLAVWESGDMPAALTRFAAALAAFDED